MLNTRTTQINTETIFVSALTFCRSQSESTCDSRSCMTIARAFASHCFFFIIASCICSLLKEKFNPNENSNSSIFDTCKRTYLIFFNLRFSVICFLVVDIVAVLFVLCIQKTIYQIIRDKIIRNYKYLKILQNNFSISRTRCNQQRLFEVNFHSLLSEKRLRVHKMWTGTT